MHSTRRVVVAGVSAAVTLTAALLAIPSVRAGESEFATGTVKGTSDAAAASESATAAGDESQVEFRTVGSSIASGPQPVAKPAGPPTDYIAKAKTLSQPKYGTARQAVQVPMKHDGTHLYVEIVRPDPKKHGNGPWPVIMEASPYHGTLADRDGTRIFPDPAVPPKNADEEEKKLGLTGYFGPRGYAVVMVDLRGTGRSEGCLDHLGPNDAKDLKEIIEWAAAQKWSNGKVGLTGHSYVGSTPSIAAAQNPKGLATIVPSAGLSSMYDHQFHNGVPWFLQWAGPQWSYEALAIARDVPLPEGFRDPVLEAAWGDNADNAPNPDLGCGLPNSALTAGPGQTYGQYDGWHAERDWREGSTAANVPIFMVHGVNDNAARIPSSDWFFGRRFDHTGDKVWLGQWDHGSTDNTTCSEPHPNCRFDQWQYALHAWFDKHLMGRDVDTGPPVETFLNGEKAWTASSWSKPPAALTLYPDATTEALGPSRPGEDGSAGFFTVSSGPTTSEGSVEFKSAPLKADRVFVGIPSLRLQAAQSTSQALNLVATLYREDAEGERHPMTHCAMQTLLRESLEEPSPVSPGEVMDLRPGCFTMAHRVPAGDRMVLEVDTSSPHHVSMHSTDAQVEIFTGPDSTRLALPLAPHDKVYEDVQLHEDDPYAALPPGPAQATITGKDTARAPGAGVRSPVSSSFFEFDVTSKANARLEALVTWAESGDIDLYLERELPDGTWEEVAAGESGEPDNEKLALELPQLGHYRLELHNWLMEPGKELAITITFYNKDGKPGPAPKPSS